MKKLFIFLSICTLAFAQDALAVKSKPGIVKNITQSDGTTMPVMQMGDEHFHYYTSPDGQPLLFDSKGMLRFADIAEVEKEATAALNRKSVKRRAMSRATNESSGVGLFGDLFPHTGSPRALIILVAFSDMPFKVDNPKEYYENFLNQEGFAEDDATGSVRDYFIATSNGQFSPTFDVYGPVTLDNYAKYGKNDRYGDDENADQMIIEACRALDDEIDFTVYDTNGDKYVDNVYVIYAGQGEASYGDPNTIWPHQWEIELAGKSLSLDGVRINNYGCCNEWDDFKPDGIGTFCHEFGHVIGLPDLYSYSRSVATPGEWDIMDDGSYNNDSHTPPAYSSFERNALGWIDLKEMVPGETVELENLYDSNTAYIVPTDDKNEFFLFENRQQTGWDWTLPHHGMLIWHIKFDKFVWESNSVNDSKQYVDIEEASGKANNRNQSIMKGYPFPGTSENTEFSDITEPNMLSWNGKPSELIITNITEDTDKGLIYFDVISTKEPEDKGEEDSITDVYTDGADAVYYNLQGIKLNECPSAGLYLRHVGGKFEKVYIK